MPPRQAVPLGTIGTQWSLLSGCQSPPFGFCSKSRSERSSSHCQALTPSPICGKPAWFIWLKKRAPSPLEKHEHLSYKSGIQSRPGKSAYSPLCWGAVTPWLPLRWCCPSGELLRTPRPPGRWDCRWNSALSTGLQQRCAKLLYITAWG